MQHLDEGTIHAWLDDALPDDERARVAAHVAVCADCAARAAEARGMIAAAGRIVSSLDIVRGNVLPSRKTAAPRPLWRRLRLTPARAALAATLLLAVGSMLTIRHDGGRSALAPQTDVAPTVARPAAAPNASVAPLVAPVPAPAPAAVIHRDQPAREATRKQSAPSPSPTGSSNAIAAAPIPAPAAQAASQFSERAAGAKPDTAAVGARVRAAMDAMRSAELPGRANAAPAPSMRMLSGTSNVEAPFAGCYAVTSDTARALAQLPARFALQTTEQQNVVRAVTSDGRVDSIVPGSVWHPLNNTRANVTWATARGPGRLQLSLVGNEVHAQAATPSGELRPVGLVRSSCRP